MRELEDLLPMLEPPAGGLARLRRRIASGQPRAHWPRWRFTWVAAACVLVVAALAAEAPTWIAQRRQTVAVTAALRQSLSPRLPAEGIAITDGAAIELPSGQDNVKLYLVQSAPRHRQVALRTLGEPTQAAERSRLF